MAHMEQGGLALAIGMTAPTRAQMLAMWERNKKQPSAPNRAKLEAFFKEALGDRCDPDDLFTVHEL